MAGHSQFKNIMYRKGAQDAKRAKVFTKIIRELTVAAKTGLADPNANPRLRAAMIAARDANMPKDTMERAIKRGAGGDDGTAYDEVRYEGYGPGGVARDHRGADRQPQPHRRRDPHRASPRPAAISARPIPCPSCSSARASSPIRPRRRARTRSSRPRSKPAPTMSRAMPTAHEITCATGGFRRRARCARKEVRPGARGQAAMAAAQHRAGGRRCGGFAAEADRRLWKTMTTSRSSARISRCPTTRSPS